MRIDKDLLLAEVNAIKIAEYIGMTVVKRGDNYFIPCPGHQKRIGKEDTNIGNCVLYENGYLCYSCDPGKIHDVFDMVQEFTGCSFPEALQTIAEFYGGEEVFASNSPIVEKLTLSDKDLKLIGLVNNCKSVCPENASYCHFEPSEGTTIQKKDDEYLLMSVSPPPSLLKLKKENIDAYNELIATCAYNTGCHLRKAIENYTSRNASGAATVYEYFEQNGGVDDSVFFGLRNALLEKIWRCKEIYDSHKKVDS